MPSEKILGICIKSMICIKLVMTWGITYMMYLNVFLTLDILHGNHLQVEPKLKSLSLPNVNVRSSKSHLEKLEALVLSLE